MESGADHNQYAREDKKRWQKAVDSIFVGLPQNDMRDVFRVRSIVPLISSNIELTIIDIRRIIPLYLRWEDSLRKTGFVFQAVCIIIFCITAGYPLWASAVSEDELVTLAKSGRKVVIADFGLGFCQQCKKQAATLNDIRESYGDKVIIRMVNVGKEQALTSRYEVELIPTLVFIDPKGKIVLKKIGPLGYEEIRAQLSRMGVD